MGFLRDLFRLRKQAKEIADQVPMPSLSESLHVASQTLSEVPEMLRDIGQMQADAERLRAEGVPGTARIRAVHDTGMTLGPPAQESPVADLELEVTVGTEPPSRVVSRQIVPRLAVGRLVPGASLPVKVDPLDHGRLVVDWDAPVD